MPEYAAEAVLSAQATSPDEAHKRQQQGTWQLLLARVFFFASAYVVSAILARKLGATDYGIYGVVISQLLWLEMMANAGVPGATAKLMAEGRHDPGDIERSARALLLGLSFLLVVVCWLLAPVAATLMRIPDGAVLFRVAIIDLPFAGMYAAYNGILYGRRRFGVLALTQVVYGVTKVAGVVGLISLGFSVGRVLLVNVLSTFAVCAILALYFRLHGFRPSGRVLREIVSLAAPMALILVLSQVLVILDLWLLKSLWGGGGEVIGQYVASVNLARALMVIPAAQAGVLFVSVAWAVASSDTVRAQRHVQEATRFALVIAVAACAILGGDASEVLSLLFSSAYSDGQNFLRLLLAGFGLFAVLDAFSNALMAARRQWLVAAVLIAVVPFVWLSNYLLIPRIGPIGAATSMLMGVTLATGVTGALVYRYFGSPVRSSTLVRVLVAGVAVGLVSAAIPVRAPLVVVKVGLLGGFYLFVLHVLGEITLRDLGLSVKIPTDRPA